MRNAACQADAATVLQRTLLLPTLHQDVFAVSDQFASDIISDPYLSEVMAPHLREALRLKPDYEQARQQLRGLGIAGPD